MNENPKVPGDTDERRLEAFLRERLGDGGLAIRQLHLQCISRIYRAERTDGSSAFVKWGKVSDSHALEFLAAVGDHPLFPKALPGQPFELDGMPVFCFEWMSLERVRIDQMSDRQFESFMAGYRELYRLMQRHAVADDAATGERWRKIIADYVCRHPVARWLLSPLLALEPDDTRHPAGAELAITHGDLHSRNFGFNGERLAAFLDFDNFIWAFPIEDLAFAFAESARQSDLCWRPWRRRRLARRLSAVAVESGRPIREWEIALNLIRLVQAAKSLSRHPDRLRVAFNVMARDRRLRGVIKLIRKVSENECA